MLGRTYVLPPSYIPAPSLLYLFPFLPGPKLLEPRCFARLEDPTAWLSFASLDTRAFKALGS